MHNDKKRVKINHLKKKFDHEFYHESNHVCG